MIQKFFELLAVFAVVFVVLVAMRSLIIEEISTSGIAVVSIGFTILVYMIEG